MTPTTPEQIQWEIDLLKGEKSMYLDQICALTNVPIPDPNLAAQMQ